MLREALGISVTGYTFEDVSAILLGQDSEHWSGIQKGLGYQVPHSTPPSTKESALPLGSFTAILWVFLL